MSNRIKSTASSKPNRYQSFYMKKLKTQTSLSSELENGIQETSKIIEREIESIHLPNSRNLKRTLQAKCHVHQDLTEKKRTRGGSRTQQIRPEVTLVIKNAQVPSEHARVSAEVQQFPQQQTQSRDKENTVNQASLKNNLQRPIPKGQITECKHVKVLPRSGRKEDKKVAPDFNRDIVSVVEQKKAAPLFAHQQQAFQGQGIQPLKIAQKNISQPLTHFLQVQAFRLANPAIKYSVKATQKDLALKT